MMRWLALLVGLVVLTVGVAYLAAPYVAERWVYARLAELGFEDVTVHIGHPGLQRASIPMLSLATSNYRLEARDITLTYHWRGLLAGRLGHVEAANVNAVLTPTGGDGERQLPPLGDPWSLLPVDRITLPQTHITLPAENTSAAGSLTLDPEHLRADLDVTAPHVQETTNVAVTITRSGMARVQMENHALGRLLAAAEPTDETLDVRAELTLEQTLLTTLIERPGTTVNRARLTATAAIVLPWPLTELPDISDLRAEGHATAVYAGATSTLALSAELAAGATLDGNTLVLTPSPDSAMTVTGETLVATIRPARLVAARDGGTLTLALSGRADLNAGDGSWSVETSTKQDLIARVETESGNVQLPEIALAFDARAGELRHRGHLTGRGALTDQVATMAADVALKNAPMLPISLTHDLGSGRGSLSIRHDATIKSPLLAALLPTWRPVADLERGTLNLELDAVWPADLQPTVSGHVRVRNGRMNVFDDYVLEGVTADLDVAASPGSVTLNPSPVTVGDVDIGFPVTDIRARIGLTGDTLTATNIHGHTLGGTFAIDDLRYAINDGSSHFTARVTGLSVAEVLALEGKDLNGTGTLDGELPVTVDDNVISMIGGRLEARPPGGHFQYASAASIADSAGQPAVDFALRALDDFRYEYLSVAADYAEDGTLTLRVRLEGRNPAVQAGRAIHYNVNVTENIPALLTSLRLADGVTEGLQKRLER